MHFYIFFYNIIELFSGFIFEKISIHLHVFSWIKEATPSVQLLERTKKTSSLRPLEAMESINKITQGLSPPILIDRKHASSQCKILNESSVKKSPCAKVLPSLSSPYCSGMGFGTVGETVDIAVRTVVLGI